MSVDSTFLCLYGDVDGNKLAQVWNIEHHFRLSCFRRVVDPTVNRTFLGLCYNKPVN